MHAVPEEELPDLLVRADIVEQLARDEGWDERHWRRWESLKSEIVAHGAKHLDLIYAPRDDGPRVVGVAAYHSNVSGFESATVNSSFPCPVLDAVAVVKVHLDRAADAIGQQP